MNIRKYKSDKEVLIDEGTRILSYNDESEFLRKVTLVLLMLRGMSPQSLSECCGEARRTLSDWIKAVDEHGFEALRAKKQPGRPGRLTPEQKADIKVAIASAPSEFGYNVWDGPTLSHYIGEKYGISLGIRQCQRLFHELGFSLIRPQTFPSKGDEDTAAREDFKKNLQN